MIKDKVRYGKNLHCSIVEIVKDEVWIKAIGGTWAVKANEGEDINKLKSQICNLLEGTPADIESVQALMSLVL